VIVDVLFGLAMSMHVLNERQIGTAVSVLKLELVSMRPVLADFRIEGVIRMGTESEDIEL
jgi:hypothetical protein